MRPEEFEFDSRLLSATSDLQRALLDAIAELIRTTQPTALDLDQVAPQIDADRVDIMFPHRSRPECEICLDVSDDEVIVCYGTEHQHFSRKDPEGGELWPIDAPDFMSAATLLFEQLLLGRIELETRHGRLSQKSVTYWTNDLGEREIIARSATVLPRLRLTEPSVVHFTFGASS